MLAAAVALLVACGGGASPPEGTASRKVTVLAASSLTDAFTEAGAAFEAGNPGTTVVFSFGGSSSLAAQVVEGAPADVFAAADEFSMAQVLDAGAAAGAVQPLATNGLEIAVAPGNPERIASLADLARDDLTVVLCAERVPCGRFALEVLARRSIELTPESLEESSRAVLTKIELGEADAGIVYRTDVLAASNRVSGVPIPAEDDVVAHLAVVLTGAAREPDAAAAFVAYLIGPEGQAVLARHGFGPAAP
jgi:molybdate transport system substrate-binding protein